MDYKKELKKAVTEFKTKLVLDGFTVLKEKTDASGKFTGVQIVIPGVKENTELHYATKGLYDAARDRRDWEHSDKSGKKPTWFDIDIPAIYWPARSDRARGTNSVAPLFKLSIGRVSKEFDLSDSLELLKNKVNEWLMPQIEERWNAYHKHEKNKPLMLEYSALLAETKPIISLSVDESVKLQMLTPLLTSKGYAKVEDLLAHLIDLATGKVKERNLDLLAKVENV